ncbi:hypothetical protein F3Y22_tig00012840pilonHSYRG00006 [Hibiscus syriacus]|uniref:Uncharacterized protein n=1 Tax=Hibiscus syriacus TaxID=106335 RepID=A0A6A3C2Z4_HIBSY|nr:hypothetical protein F3Y22_tig00012840pilonHSYRG00006 [Hibiscus syriacus]
MTWYIDDNNEWLTGRTYEDAQEEFVFKEDEGPTWGHIATVAGVYEERFNLISRGSSLGGRDGSSWESLRQRDGDEDEEGDEGHHSFDGDHMKANLAEENDYI